MLETHLLGTNYFRDLLSFSHSGGGTTNSQLQLVSGVLGALLITTLTAYGGMGYMAGWHSGGCLGTISCMDSPCDPLGGGGVVAVLNWGS